MRLCFKAHFDGKVIVPDERADVGALPVDRPLTVNVDVQEAVSPSASPGDRRRALGELFSRPPAGVTLSDEDLRRESIYGDDD